MPAATTHNVSCGVPECHSVQQLSPCVLAPGICPWLFTTLSQITWFSLLQKKILPSKKNFFSESYSSYVIIKSLCKYLVSKKNDAITIIVCKKKKAQDRIPLCCVRGILGAGPRLLGASGSQEPHQLRESRFQRPQPDHRPAVQAASAGAGRSHLRAAPGGPAFAAPRFCPDGHGGPPLCLQSRAFSKVLGSSATARPLGHLT